MTVAEMIAWLEGLNPKANVEIIDAEGNPTPFDPETHVRFDHFPLVIEADGAAYHDQHYVMLGTASE